jgi:hypothetical protein
MKNCLKIGHFQSSFSLCAAPFGAKSTTQKFNMDLIVINFGYLGLVVLHLGSEKKILNDPSLRKFSMVFWVKCTKYF